MSPRPSRRPRVRRDDAGQALVEFALVLPVLTMVLFAIIQFGLFFYTYIDLTSATRDGARVAAVSAKAADGPGAVRTAIGRSTSVVDDAQTSITVTPGQPWKSGDSVDVQVSVPYKLTVLGVVLWSGPMKADAIARVE